MKSHYLIPMCTLLVICSACTSIQDVKGQELSITGVYVDDHRESVAYIIEICANGVCYFSYDGCPPGLAHICERQEGRWIKKENRLIISTVFQDKIEDFLVPTGDGEGDSIAVTIYSMETRLPSSRECIFFDRDGFVYPDSNGLFVIPCDKRERLEGCIKGLLSRTDVVIECGKKYNYFFKDCYCAEYNKKEFIITDSALIECEYGARFNRMGTW